MMKNSFNSFLIKLMINGNKLAGFNEITSVAFFQFFFNQINDQLFHRIHRFSLFLWFSIWGL